MFLSEALAIIQTLQCIKKVVCTVYSLAKPAIADIQTLVKIGMDIKNRNDLYMSNKQACIDIITQVSLLQGTIETINKHYPSNYPQQLEGHVKSLNNFLETALDLIKDNILPANLSWLKRKYWIAKQIHNSSKITSQLEGLLQNVHQTVSALGLSVGVQVSQIVQGSYDLAVRQAEDVMEIKRFVMQQNQQLDTFMISLLEILEPRDTDQAIQSLFASQTNMNQSMQKIQFEFKRMQTDVISQSEQLQHLIEQCYQLMRTQGEWDVEFMNRMSDLDNKLNLQTTTIVQHLNNINVDIHNQLTSQLSRHHRHLLESILEKLQPQSSSTTTSETKAIKYKFKEFTIDELEIDWNDIIGEGAGGEVIWGKVTLLPTPNNEIAFKKLALPIIRSRPSCRGGRGRGVASITRLSNPSNTSSSQDSDITDPCTSFVTLAKDLLQREARVIWLLNGHPNCVRLYGICLEPAGLVFQYCNGGTLQSLLYVEVPVEDGKIKYVPETVLDVEDKLSCVNQLLAGLYFLHSKGFVHRDVKSCNCLAHNCGTPDDPIWNFKWTDFGSARKLADFVSTSSFSTSDRGLKQSGGTVRWMSPERRDSSITPEQRDRIEKQTSIDIYGLGCILGEIFLQKPPFANRTVNEVRELGPKVLPFDNDDLLKLKPSLANLIRKCCAPDPPQRISMEKILYVEWPKVCFDQGVSHTPIVDQGVSHTPISITSISVMSSVTDMSSNIRSPPPILPRPSALSPLKPVLLGINAICARLSDLAKLPQLTGLDQEKQLLCNSMLSLTIADQLSIITHLEWDDQLQVGWKKLIFDQLDHADQSIQSFHCVCELISRWSIWLESYSCLVDCLPPINIILEQRMNDGSTAISKSAFLAKQAVVGPGSSELDRLNDLSQHVQYLKATVTSVKLVQLHVFPHLQHLSLEKCYIGGSQCQSLSNNLKSVPLLTSLNISSNGIGDVGCQSLSNNLASVPLLTGLDIRSNGIGDVGCQSLSNSLASVPLLTHLYISSNGIGDVGCQSLSNNLASVPLLTHLDISSNGIGDVGCQSLSNNLASVSLLTRLYISSNEISAVGCQSLSNNLKSVPLLTSLDIRSNGIGDVGCQSLSNNLASVPLLTGLDIRSNEISAVGCQSLSNNLASVPLLTHLDIRSNAIGSVGCQSLSNNLKSVPLLTYLNINSNEIGSVGCQSLSNNLASVPLLTGLDIRSNGIGDVGCQSLSNNLASVPLLTHLDISSNGIGAVGCQSLSNNLASVPLLTSFYICFNKISAVGCQSLSNNLKSVPLLTSLNISWNQIGSVGCQSLSNNLKSVPLLTSLNIRSNGIVGCQSLSNNLASVPLLTSLNISSNKISSVGCHSLSNNLKSVPLLTTLDISCNKISAVGCHSLSNNLKSVPLLTSLNIRSNGIGDVGCQSLSDNLASVPLLTHLDISWNEISAVGCQSLSNNLKSVPLLTSLNISDNPISDAGCQSLSNNLTSVPLLTSLNIRSNWIGGADCLVVNH